MADSYRVPTSMYPHAVSLGSFILVPGTHQISNKR